MKHAHTPLWSFLSTISFSLTAVAVVGCGGGGGGDDQDSIPSQCRSYCSFACSKASRCGFFPGSQIASCDDSCTRTIAANGTNAATCDRQGVTIAAASCSQLASILGLRSSENEPVSSMKQDHDAEMVAEHSGAELALSASAS
jgi:hypothetical protein